MELWGEGELYMDPVGVGELYRDPLEPDEFQSTAFWVFRALSRSFNAAYLSSGGAAGTLLTLFDCAKLKLSNAVGVGIPKQTNIVSDASKHVVRRKHDTNKKKSTVRTTLRTTSTRNETKQKLTKPTAIKML
jgi:hypothetical protein